MLIQEILYWNSREGLLVLLGQPMDFQSIVVEFLIIAMSCYFCNSEETTLNFSITTLKSVKEK